MATGGVERRAAIMGITAGRVAPLSGAGAGVGAELDGQPGFCELSLDGRLRRVSDALCRMLGQPSELLLGTTLSDVTDAPLVQRTEEALVRVLDTGEPRAVESRLVRSDGELVFVTLVLTRVDDEAGKPRGVFGVVTDLTEYRRTLEDLEESRERYRSLFHSIDEGFCVLETSFDLRGRPSDFRFIEVNPGVQRQTGLSDLEGRMVREVMPELETWWIDVCGKVALTGRAVRVEHEARCLQRWFDVYAFPLGPPESNRIALLFQDVTDRKQREMNAAFVVDLHVLLGPLRSCEDILRAAGERICAHLDATSIFFAEIDEEENTLGEVKLYRDGGVTSFSEVYRLADFVADGYLGRLRAGRSLAIDDVATHALTREHAGAYEPFEVRAQVHAPHLSDGRLRFLLGVQQDRPRRWRAHEVDLAREVSTLVWLRLERARAEDALRESEARFRLALNAADMGMWTWDPNTDEISYDDRMAEVFSAPPGATATGAWLMEHRIHPEDAPRVIEALRGALHRGGSGRYHVEYRVLRPDGGECWFLGHGAYFEEGSAAGRRARLLGVGVDITERKRTEQALRENDRRKDEFLATLAHELRNPLAPLEHGLEILRLQKGRNDEGAERVREIMSRQVSHMCRLVDDLLEVSRITRGKIELRTERVELSRVLRSAIETTRTWVDRAGHQVTVSLPGEPLYVQGDPVRLAQVFANLLNNSVKYTDPKGRIEVAGKRENGSVVVSVCDNGVGIAPEMLPRIFDMFAQAERASDRSQGGLGIGLTLVRSLVQLHGGTVEARSAGVGQGAEFVVKLPLAEERRRRERHSDDSVRLLSKERRVLVVDDNRDAAENLGMLLDMIGADVRVEYDGPSALAALDSYHPNVALLDLGMPGMDGFELARRIQQHPSGRDVMIVAMTGWGQEEDRRRTREAGFAHHLVKPADIGSLRGILSEKAG